MPKLYRVQGVHLVDRLRLKDLRDRMSRPPVHFSNYEMVLSYSADSYAFIYNYGSAVFFNVSDEVRERELTLLQETRPPSSPDMGRLTDVFSLELKDPGDGDLGTKVFFDRVVCAQLTYQKIRIVCMLLAESTALDYYEDLSEKMLDQTNVYSRRLETTGKLLAGSGEFIRFIGRCLSTKQEIISNLYIVDSPDETWDDPELDRLHQELKVMLEVDVRYRALEYKIKIIQDSLEIFVDLSKNKRETILEVIIILLIAVELLISLFKWTAR